MATDKFTCVKRVTLASGRTFQCRAHNMRVLMLCSTLLLLLPLLLLTLPQLAHAQVQIQQSSLRVSRTTADYSPLLPSSFAQCPSGTQHVLAERAIDAPINEAMPIIANISIGCCPNNTYGCWDENDNRLSGCCSEFQPGVPPVCCYNSGRQMFACARYAAQCCGTNVCDSSYACCGNVCCPNGNTDPNNITGVCDIQQVTDPVTNVTVPVVQGCLNPGALERCTVTQTYNVSCPPGSNFSQCPFCKPGQDTCIFPNTSAPLLNQLCYPGDCVRTNITIQNCTTVLVGCTDGVSVLDLPVGCSSTPTLPMCVYTPVGDVPLLIARKPTGYTCCGPFVCSPGMRCCSLNTTTTDSYGAPLTVTTYFGCCPDVPAIECCYNNIMDPTDPRQAANFFCGAAFNSTSCQVDKLRAAAYFGLSLLNRGGS